MGYVSRLERFFAGLIVVALGYGIVQSDDNQRYIENPSVVLNQSGSISSVYIPEGMRWDFEDLVDSGVYVGTTGSFINTHGGRVIEFEDGIETGSAFAEGTANDFSYVRDGQEYKFDMKWYVELGNPELLYVKYGPEGYNQALSDVSSSVETLATEYLTQALDTLTQDELKVLTMYIPFDPVTFVMIENDDGTKSYIDYRSYFGITREMEDQQYQLKTQIPKAIEPRLNAKLMEDYNLTADVRLILQAGNSGLVDESSFYAPEGTAPIGGTRSYSLDEDYMNELEDEFDDEESWGNIMQIAGLLIAGSSLLGAWPKKKNDEKPKGTLTPQEYLGEDGELLFDADELFENRDYSKQRIHYDE